MEADCWYVLSDEHICGDAELTIRHDNDTVTLSVQCRPAEYENVRCCKIVFKEGLVPEIRDKISGYLQLEDKLEKRREERYEVGLRSKRWRVYGFKAPEQKLFLNRKFYMDCVVVNVSAHGALVLGGRNGLIPGESLVTLCMEFVAPKETVIERALVVNADSPARGIFRYSLSLVAPSVAWKERLSKYIDYLYLNENGQM